MHLCFFAKLNIPCAYPGSVRRIVFLGKNIQALQFTRTTRFNFYGKYPATISFPRTLPEYLEKSLIYDVINSDCFSLTSTKSSRSDRAMEVSSITIMKRSLGLLKSLYWNLIKG